MVNSRRKGHGWEREFIRKFWKQLDPNAKRNLEYQSHSVVDIDTELPFALQLKNRKTWAGWEALKELNELKDDDRIKVGIIKQKSKGSCAILSIEDFIKLVKTYIKNGDTKGE